MILTIALMTALTVAVAAYALAPHMAEGRVVFGQEPDEPAPFGYKMAWLAVRTRDPEAVVEELGLIAAEPCNWRSGIGTVYDDSLGPDHVFVSPPVNGWTFVGDCPSLIRSAALLQTNARLYSSAWDAASSRYNISLPIRRSTCSHGHACWTDASCVPSPSVTAASS